MQYDLFGEPIKPDPAAGKPLAGAGDATSVKNLSQQRAITTRDWFCKPEPFMWEKVGDVTTILKIESP